MNQYQNFIDGPLMGAGNNSRQAPSPSGMMNGANGMMGGAGGQNIMPIAPPGHQADLNVILGYVEQLHEQLAANKSQTDRIVASCGAIRQRAIEQQKEADEIIKAASEDFAEKHKSLDEEARVLREKLDKESHEHGEWKTLAQSYANAMQSMLEQAHAFKVKTANDMAVWHRSYRDQLAAEREENLRLRLQVGDMQAAAQRGNEYLQSFLREWDGSERVMKMREEVVYYRQNARAWKRTALKMLPDDDSEFSDDDDIIDPEEKKRKAERQAEADAKRALMEDMQERGLDPKNGKPLNNGGLSQAYLQGAQGLGMNLGNMSSTSAVQGNSFSNANAAARQNSTGIATNLSNEEGEELEEFPHRDDSDTESVLTDASVVSESEIVMQELMAKSGLYASENEREAEQERLEEERRKLAEQKKGNEKDQESPEMTNAVEEVGLRGGAGSDSGVEVSEREVDEESGEEKGKEAAN